MERQAIWWLSADRSKLAYCEIKAEKNQEVITERLTNLPRLDYCPALEVYIPLGDEIFVARFKQKVIQP